MILESAFATSNLVPRHSLASDADVAELLARLGKPVECLPIVRSSDAALKDLGVKAGDVVKIERQSLVTHKVEFYYRLVVED